MNDHVSDMLARIKNAYKVNKKSLELPYTKLVEEVGKVLLSKKYLSSLEIIGEGAQKSLKLGLTYVDGTPALSSAKMISKPGVRIYKKAKELKPILSGMGMAVISTSRGVMSDLEARKNKLGGEVLMELW